MKIHENIGNLDLVVRIVVLGLAIYFGHVVSKWFFLFVIWEFFLVVMRWCPVYDLLKINTLRKRNKFGGKKIK